MQVVANVEETNANAVGAHKEIEKAREHQKSGNTWLCTVLWVVGLIATGAIILVVIIEVNKHKKTP